MKIVLAALNAKYVHSNLAVFNLAEYAKTNWEKEFCTEYKEAEQGSSASFPYVCPEIVVKEYTINHNLDAILQSLYLEKADVVAFSCYIWNINEICTIVKELKKVAPKLRIWCGGPEVSYDSKKFLEKNAEIEGIIQGEGEGVFYELVKKWMQMEQRTAREQGSLYQDVAGILYRNPEGEICKNINRQLLSMDEIPFIYRDLSRFENKILYYETSRGCPFSCSYCLSSIDKSVRFRSLSLVEKELQFFLDHQVSQVKFIDRTFNCKKEHALAIWSYLVKHDNGITNFHFEVAADLIGEEELSLFRKMRPGLIQLEIGLQSTNPVTIQEIRRKMNIARLKNNMLTIKSFGNIHQHLDLIAGLPFEDYDSFQTSFNEAYAMQPDQLQLGFLKVLKGSYMSEQIEQYQLQYQDSQPYEVLSTKWISYDEILALKKVEEMVEVYYNSGQFKYTIAYLLRFFVTPYAFYETLGDYYEKNNLYGIGFKREARYEALRGFYMEWLTKDAIDKGIDIEKENSILDSLLLYDYYLRENAKRRPAWSEEEPIDKGKYHAFFKNGGNAEVSLWNEGYDSKVAARAMHIEPILWAAAEWICAGEGNEQKTQEVLTNLKRKQGICYCLFDYEKRNPLSKDAKVIILSDLY